MTHHINVEWPITTTAGDPSTMVGDPLNMGGLRPIPVATLAPPTLRDVLPAARRAGWVHRMWPVILGDEHQWQRHGVLVTWDPGSCRLSVAWDVGTERHPVWDYRLHAWLDPGSPRPLLARALGLLREMGIDVPGVTP